MQTRFGSSVLTHVLSVVAATVVTAALFTAVAFGLAGESGWSVLAEEPVAAPTA